MNFISIVLGCLLITNIFANSEQIEEKKQNIQVIKNSPFLSYSAEFIFQNDANCLGKIIRTGFMCPRYYYDLYDNDEGFTARGITRAFSLGLIYSRATDIDIYDNQDNVIGMIIGKILKRSRIKFNFYDAYQNPTATAYINGETNDIILVSANNPSKILAKFTGQSFGEVGYINIDFISGDTTIDVRIIKVFAAFVSDFYENFMPYYMQNGENLDVVKDGIQLSAAVLDAYLKHRED